MKKTYRIAKSLRITEWLLLERTLDVTQFQPLYHGQGSNPLDHISQGTILTGFEHSQGWEISRFSEQPVPEPQPPHSTLSLSLQEWCFSTLVIFVALFCDNSNMSMSFLCWDIELDAGFQRGRISSLPCWPCCFG